MSFATPSTAGGALSVLGGAHPTVNLVHTAAKVAPILVYILCELVNPGDDAFAVNFVLIVTLLGVGARSVSLSLSLSLPILCICTYMSS